MNSGIQIITINQNNNLADCYFADTDTTRKNSNINRNETPLSSREQINIRRD